MATKMGAYLGGVRTLEDLRIRCRMDECGCWIWGMGTSHGRPSVMLKIDGKHRSVVGRRAAYLLAGKGRALTSRDVVRQSDKCGSLLCVNPAHGVVGTHSDAWVAAHKRGGWKRKAEAQAAGQRIKAKMAKLDDAKAAEIRASDETQAVLAARYGVSASAISLVQRGLTWVPTSTVNSVFSPAWAAR